MKSYIRISRVFSRRADHLGSFRARAATISIARASESLFDANRGNLPPVTPAKSWEVDLDGALAPAITR
jgi:hypothetical protein